MKTDQKMSVQLDDDLALSIYHKSEMGNLTDLWLDVSRRSRSRIPNLTLWMQSDRTQRFIKKTAELRDRPAESLVEVRGSGRNARTWAHLNIIIFALEHISPEINAVVIDEFVRKRILRWRDESGDSFIDMNVMLKIKADDVLGKPAHQGHYIQIAKTLKKRIKPDSGDWNLATAAQLAERDRIETLLSEFLKNNVVRDWEHLKELAEKV